jgi:hypothetical protein
VTGYLALILALDAVAVISLVVAWWSLWHEHRRHVLPRRRRSFSAGPPCVAPSVRGVNRRGSPGGREGRLRGHLTPVNNSKEQ